MNAALLEAGRNLIVVGRAGVGVEDFVQLGGIRSRFGLDDLPVGLHGDGPDDHHFEQLPVVRSEQQSRRWNSILCGCDNVSNVPAERQRGLSDNL